MDPFRCGISRTSAFAFCTGRALNRSKELKLSGCPAELLYSHPLFKSSPRILECLHNPHPSYFPSDDTVTTGFLHQKKEKLGCFGPSQLFLTCVVRGKVVLFSVMWLA